MSNTVTVVRHKPLMTMKQVLLMNFGFFGIQYSFGMQQTAVNPIYTYLGANPHDLPLLNLAGPLTGLLVQPVIGALSDRTWHPKWGRRKPFFIIGAIGCSVCLFLFPFASAIWMAVMLLWLLDISNNTAMEPYRAFIADKLPPSQLGKGFLAQSFFTGLGITLANLSLFAFQALITGATAAGIPYWVVGAFMLGAVCSIGSVLISVISTPELPRPSASWPKCAPRRPVAPMRWDRSRRSGTPSSRCRCSCASWRWYTSSSGTECRATGSSSTSRSPRVPSTPPIP
ncbi:MAG: MFS transporter [Micropruina sp.]